VLWEASNKRFPQQKPIQPDNNSCNHPAEQHNRPGIGEAAHDFAVGSKKYERDDCEAQLQRKDYLTEHQQISCTAFSI
jgi:hypothetical protein